jgi:hypothetical protein
MNHRTQKPPSPQINCTTDCFMFFSRTSRKATRCVAKYFIRIALLPYLFQALEDDCSNAHSILGNQSGQALLWSRRGIGVRRPGPLNPLSTTTPSQPSRTRKDREVNCRGFACENIFRTRVPAVTRVILKRDQMKTWELVEYSEVFVLYPRGRKH